ncbi:hypothetical protein JHK84_052540 [Glycine max]|nr:hypothetical protein JHK84_052540 [Glycine max]
MATSLWIMDRAFELMQRSDIIIQGLTILAPVDSPNTDGIDPASDYLWICQRSNSGVLHLWLWGNMGVKCGIYGANSAEWIMSTQWRVSSSQGLGNYELGKASWSWSWKDHWVAALPTFNYVMRMRAHTAYLRQITKQTEKNAMLHLLRYCLHGGGIVLRRRDGVLCGGSVVLCLCDSVVVVLFFVAVMGLSSVAFALV